MPIAPDFPVPRRYNSLRLQGFDYSNSSALFFISMNTDSSRPVFADFKLAKEVLSAVLSDRTGSRIQVRAFTLLPDHMHLLAGVKTPAKRLSDSLGSFKSYTTSRFWSRSREAHESKGFETTQPIETRGNSDRAQLLGPLMEWRATLLPEAIRFKNWPRLQLQHFVSKQLWHRGFHEHIIRNEQDLRETINYIAMNPVERGYVSRPQFYPFTGFDTAGLFE